MGNAGALEIGLDTPEIQKYHIKDTKKYVVLHALGQLKLVTRKHQEPLNSTDCNRTMWHRSVVLTRFLWVEWLRDECQVHLVTETTLSQPCPLLHPHLPGRQTEKLSKHKNKNQNIKQWPICLYKLWSGCNIVMQYKCDRIIESMTSFAASVPVLFLTHLKG